MEKTIIEEILELRSSLPCGFAKSTLNNRACFAPINPLRPQLRAGFIDRVPPVPDFVPVQGLIRQPPACQVQETSELSTCMNSDSDVQEAVTQATALQARANGCPASASSAES